MGKSEAKSLLLAAIVCFLPLIIFLISVLAVPIFNLRQAWLYFPEISLIMAIGLIFIASYILKQLKIPSFREGWLFLIIPLLVINLLGVYWVYTIDTKDNWREIILKVTL